MTVFKVGEAASEKSGKYGQCHIRGLRAAGSGNSKIQRGWDSVYGLLLVAVRPVTVTVLV